LKPYHKSKKRGFLLENIFLVSKNSKKYVPKLKNCGSKNHNYSEDVCIREVKSENMRSFGAVREWFQG